MSDSYLDRLNASCLVMELGRRAGYLVFIDPLRAGKSALSGGSVAAKLFMAYGKQILLKSGLLVIVI